jgi:hypothetical protein
MNLFLAAGSSDYLENKYDFDFADDESETLSGTSSTIMKPFLVKKNAS